MIHTGDIQKFVICSLTGQNQPVKKLTALTGEQALQSMSMMSELSADTDELIADFSSNDNGDYSMEQLSSYDKRLKSILQVCETVYKGFGHLYKYFKL